MWILSSAAAKESRSCGMTPGIRQTSIRERHYGLGARRRVQNDGESCGTQRHFDRTYTKVPVPGRANLRWGISTRGHLDIPRTAGGRYRCPTLLRTASGSTLGGRDDEPGLPSITRRRGGGGRSPIAGSKNVDCVDVDIVHLRGTGFHLSLRGAAVRRRSRGVFAIQAAALQTGRQRRR